MKFLLLAIPLLAWSSPICLFTPPNGWEIAQPKQLSEHVQIGFLGKSSSGFRPSINIAEEVIDCSLKDYVKAVKEIHLAEPNTKWRDLGKIETRSGKGVLTEITTPSPWGEIAMLQALFVHETKAYILTAAVLKKEFVSLQKELIQSLRSLEIVPDLISAVPRKELKNELELLFESASAPKQAEKWKMLQKWIEKNGEEMGSYWQFLALKEGYEKIYSPSKSQF